MSGIIVKDKRGETPEEQSARLRAEEDAKSWPAGKACPPGGWLDAFQDNAWLACELGLASPMTGTILTKVVQDERIITRGVGGSTADAILHEVVAIAPDIDPSHLYHPEIRPFGMKVGDHVVHMAAAADRVDPDNDDCPWFNVEIPDVAMIWDAEHIVSLLKAAGRCSIDELRGLAATRRQLMQKSREDQVEENRNNLDAYYLRKFHDRLNTHE